MPATTHAISEMLISVKQSKNINNVPSQFIHILEDLNKMVADLQKRVEKLETEVDGGTF
jgi:hypothetical protein